MSQQIYKKEHAKKKTFCKTLNGIFFEFLYYMMSIIKNDQYDIIEKMRELKRKLN